MRDTLNVAVREQLGTRQMRRLRENGLVPAVLYGHGEPSISLSIANDQVRAAIRHGARLVDLAGAVTETALVRQVQWDAFGIEVLHLDLSRVSAGETVEIVLPIELKGMAIGTKEGGVVEHVKHEAKILCPVLSIPEKLLVNVSNMHIGQAITLAEVVLPEGAQLLTDPEEIVVHCVTPMSDDELEAGATAEAGEPEVIGRKKDDEAGADEEA